MRIFITGVSSGLGEALSMNYLSSGVEVFGISRREPKRLIGMEGFSFQKLNLGKAEEIERGLLSLIEGIDSFDIVILNAGILGEIEDMRDVNIEELKHIMQVNVWSNKTVIDTFLQSNIDIKQVIAISSGAAVNGSRGWNGYSISKAALNILIKLYASEEEKTHFISLAPGLIHTPMLDRILNKSDSEKFQSIERLRRSDEAGEVFSAAEAASRLKEIFLQLRAYESGSFLDTRAI